MPAPVPDREHVAARNIGVGCVTTFAGFFSGGMVGVFVAKMAGSVQSCRPPEGLPACNWYVYAGVGAVLGAVTLPVLALRRLSQPRRDE
jgi:hypothetical protein